MEFEWSTNDIAKKTVTIYSTNLTLNKAACRHFEEVDFVLLGIEIKMFWELSQLLKKK